VLLGWTGKEASEREVLLVAHPKVALAVALESTPNRLLLPELDIEHAEDAGQLTPVMQEAPRALWTWATGEAPLGHPAVTAADGRAERNAEVAFSRDNRQQHWTAPARPVPPVPITGITTSDRVLAVSSLAMFAQAALAVGLSTADIRSAVEAALAGALLHPAPAGALPRVEGADGKITLYLDPPDSPGRQEGR